jgi:hypothetical protein
MMKKTGEWVGLKIAFPLVIISNYIIQFNSLFFILTCWLNSNKSQLQSKHKKIINVQKYAYA